jgi:hypothetical protein
MATTTLNSNGWMGKNDRRSNDERQRLSRLPSLVSVMVCGGLQESEQYARVGESTVSHRAWLTLVVMLGIDPNIKNLIAGSQT